MIVLVSAHQTLEAPACKQGAFYSSKSLVALTFRMKIGMKSDRPWTMAPAVKGFGGTDISDEDGYEERPTLNDGSGWALNPECYYLNLP